eukprot:1529856-Rhodomonas_salina.4
MLVPFHNCGSVWGMLSPNTGRGFVSLLLSPRPRGARCQVWLVLVLLAHTWHCLVSRLVGVDLSCAVVALRGGRPPMLTEEVISADVIEPELTASGWSVKQYVFGNTPSFGGLVSPFISSLAHMRLDPCDGGSGSES